MTSRSISRLLKAYWKPDGSCSVYGVEPRAASFEATSAQDALKSSARKSAARTGPPRRREESTASIGASSCPDCAGAALLPPVAGTTVVAMQVHFVLARHRCGRIVRAEHALIFSASMSMASVREAQSISCAHFHAHEHRRPRPPVARVNQQVADRPALRIDQQCLRRARTCRRGP